MSGQQILALYIMLMVGSFSFIFWENLPEFTKTQRILYYIWIVFWLVPPLSVLWVKGVFG